MGSFLGFSGVLGRGQVKPGCRAPVQVGSRSRWEGGRWTWLRPCNGVLASTMPGSMPNSSEVL